MLEENQNLKNSLKDVGPNLITAPDKGRQEGLVSFSRYSKTNKLVTALYMVTDIMDKAEPLRSKLRTLGINIVSDIKLVPDSINNILSLLDIAFALKMISEMNCSILKKEFLELKQFIQESNVQNNPVWLEEFFMESSPSPLQGEGGGEVSLIIPKKTTEIGQKNSIGHGNQNSSRLGVQKGSTLMKALQNVHMSNRIASPDFNTLKKQRREEILKIIKTSPNGATITDIRTLATGSLVSCGEKTLQRELVSMTHDGVLEKTGEKRWSRYSLKR